MNNFEHAARLTELTDLGAHELALRVIELELKRDALAAHVKWSKKLIQHLIPHAEFGLQGQPFEKLTPDAKRYLKDTPETSLARRDLIKQAEVLEEMADDQSKITADQLYVRARMRRKEADAL